LTLPQALASLPGMNIVQEILDFFLRLIRGRIDSVEIQAKSKAMAAEARVKGAAAKRFNQTVDGAIGKAKGSVTSGQPGAQGREPHPSAAKKS
jgi:hypothetical protein